ncbi:hypothetical protein MD484_g6378, partial [Candolleomyces efflorescens]
MASDSAEEVHAAAAIVGRRILTNVSYADRVADLTNSEVNSFIIGWRRHGGRNQVFNFEPQGANRDKISLTDRNGKVFHVSSPDPAPGSKLKATHGGVGSVYTIVAHAPGQVKLSILSSDGTAPLYWTLNNEDEGTKISLELDNGTANQVWGAVAPDDD